MKKSDLIYGGAPAPTSTEGAKVRGRAQQAERREQERAVLGAASRPLTKEQKTLAASIAAGRAAEQRHEGLKAFRAAIDARDASKAGELDESLEE